MIHIINVIETRGFSDWLVGLSDANARARINVRINSARGGNLGDVKMFDGIGEMRVDYGPGYRIYFVRRGARIVILLCGGDKRRQAADIDRAKQLAKEI